MREAESFKGINLIIVGELLGLFSTLIANTSSVPVNYFWGMLSNNALDQGNAVSGAVAVAVLLAGAISYASVIVLFIGFIKMSKCDFKFKEAIVITVIALLVDLSGVFLNNVFGNFVIVVSSIADLWMCVAVIQGLVNIFDKREDDTMSDKGIRVMRLVLALYVFSIIGGIMLQFFGSNPSLTNFSIIAVIIITVLQVVIYTFYIKYLFHSRKVLLVKEIAIQS